MSVSVITGEKLKVIKLYYIEDYSKYLPPIDPWIETEDGKCPEWLDIGWKGKIVEINRKGRIRDKKTKK